MLFVWGILGYIILESYIFLAGMLAIIVLLGIIFILLKEGLPVFWHTPPWQVFTIHSAKNGNINII